MPKLSSLPTSTKQLYAKIRRCNICQSNLPLGPNPVFQAHPNARMLVAAQAPGVRVHETSIPFNDPSGDRLRDWMGVDKNTFYDPEKIAIVPMGFCFPGTGKSGDLPPRPECSETWHTELLSTLPNIQFKLIIGQYAHRYYLGKRRKKTLTETVKQWREYAPEIIPLPHPSPRNNIWLAKNPWFEKELLNEIRAAVRKALST